MFCSYCRLGGFCANCVQATMSNKVPKKLSIIGGTRINTCFTWRAHARTVEATIHLFQGQSGSVIAPTKESI